MNTCISGIFLKFLPFNDIQYSTCSSHRQRIATVGAEELHIFFFVAFCYLFGANDSSNWETITHSLPNCHNIRDYSIIITSPESLSKSGKSSLNLISNTNDSFSLQFFV